MDKIQDYMLKLQLLARERRAAQQSIQTGWKRHWFQVRLRRIDALTRLASLILELERDYKITKEAQREIRQRTPGKEAECVARYLQAVERYGVTQPSFEELARATKISKSKWKCLLNDRVFLQFLMAALTKKANQQKTDRTKDPWVRRFNKIEDQFYKVLKKEEKKKQSSPPDDNRSFDDISPEIADVIREEEGRQTVGKTPKRRGANFDEK
jgi:hypothetical protein